MAHHQKHQADASRRGSAVQNLLKMFNLSTAPTVPLGEDEVAAEADEPPDDHLSELHTIHRDSLYSKAASKPQNPRRESLLTRAILAESRPEGASPTSPLRNSSRGLSTASSHSAASMASTAELTSDGDMTSPARSYTPSPPAPIGRYAQLLVSKTSEMPASKVLIAPITKDDKPAVADVGEAAIEKTLGRKRCIMFACMGVTPETKETKPAPVKEKTTEPEPPSRKSMLTFACPSRQTSNPTKSQRRPSPAPPSKRRLSTDLSSTVQQSSHPVKEVQVGAETSTTKPPTSPVAFHEFASSGDENDAWVDSPAQHKRKLTINDCLEKEMAIRQLGEEAEEEAEEEERAQEEFEAELEENEVEDDFAPSDDESDGGNESDDEGGFAESSDDESDAGSAYQFWGPSTTTAATSTENLTLSHFSSRGRSRGSSIESLNHSTSTPPLAGGKPMSKKRFSRMTRLRPGTPELPDSTDFVCGTLDEDRPLEAAYISCREQKKRSKHIPIPQDIDPSFPTTDPEDEEDNEEDEEISPGASGPMWMKDQFTGFEEEGHGRRSPPPKKAAPTPTPPRQEHPFTHGRRSTNRSPPPKRGMARSPAPRKLFGHSPTRMRSPPPPMRLRSPPGSPDGNPMVGFTINRLAQRPRMERTSSLPKTPNPFFRNFKIGSPSISNVASGAVTPALDEAPRPDIHVRGPVDIVIGLEKKRQKRKEKYWRQHCRKAAKEQAERRPAPGRGAERMRELGLECAERNRGYGIGQPAQVVISL